MIIGPGDPRRTDGRETAPKAKKAKKAEKLRRQDERAATDPQATDRVGATAAAAAAVPGPAAGPVGDPPAAPTIDGPPPAGPGPASPVSLLAPASEARPLVARIDALQGRVGALLALVDGIDAAGRSTVAGTPDAPGEAPGSSAPGTAAAPVPSAVASAPPAPSEPAGSAVLVARELLASGMAREDVRQRLGDAYGVADPDAAMTGAAAR